MKTLHPTIILGIIFLGLGIMLLALVPYLDELDKQYIKSWDLLHCTNISETISCPFAPEPYWSYLQPITYTGMALCCIGIILVSYKVLNNRMKSLQK